MTDTTDRPLTAARWWRNGDHPHDRVSVGSTREGAVVRYYRHPMVDGATVHDVCGRTWHDHGWIDQGGAGITVCPGDVVVTWPNGTHDVYSDLSGALRLLGEGVSLVRDADYDVEMPPAVHDWITRVAGAFPHVPAEHRPERPDRHATTAWWISMSEKTISVVWAPVLVEAVCDALVFHGEATSGDIARTAEQPHSQVVGVLESLAEAGYARSTIAAESHGLWSLTQAGRTVVRDGRVNARARIAELEAAIAAPVTIAPATPMPSDWPDPTAEWPLWNPDATPGPPTFGVRLVIGGAEHSLSVTGTGDVIVSLDGIPFIIYDVEGDPPEPLSRLARVRRLLAKLRGLLARAAHVVAYLFGRWTGAADASTPDRP